jgi:dephospho-CoA kinase
VLRERVFAEPDERQWLEQLLHPLIHDRIRERLSKCRSPYCLLVSPLLLETSQKALIDRILVVDVSRETQLNRTMTRDGSSRETVEAILAAQISRDARRAAADEIIDNEMTLAALRDRVDALHQTYLALSADPRSRSEHRS